MDVEIENTLAEGMEAILIETIRKHPILYDKSDVYARMPGNLEKTAEAWNKVSDELNLEVESCKTLWNCTKQKYIKYRKKLDHGEPIIKEWLAFEQIRTWLDKHVKKRRTRGDICKFLRTANNSTQQSNENHQQITPILYNSDVEGDGNESIDWDKIQEIKDERLRNQAPLKGPALRSRKETLTSIPSKRLKVEQMNDTKEQDSIEHDTDIFTEIEASELSEIQSKLLRSSTSAADLSGADEKPIEHCRDVVVEANFDKLEQIIEKCVGLAEKCIAQNKGSDATDIFGNYIAALVRELPAEKQMQARFSIIQYTGQLISKINLQK